MKSTDMKMGGGVETRQEITQGLNISRKKEKKKCNCLVYTFSKYEIKCDFVI